MKDSGINLHAYDGGYGVKVAAGDVDGDGTPELITVPGSGEYNRGKIKIWDVDTTGIGGWTAYLSEEFIVQSSYGISINIATGDVNGDGNYEIITGEGPHRKARDEIKIYDGIGEKKYEFRSYIVRHYGSNVVSSDLNGDGIDEIIIGSGSGPRIMRSLKYLMRMVMSRRVLRRLMLKMV